MANILTLEAFMHINGLQIQHSSEWEDYLEMQAQAAGMTREEWTAYYGTSIGHLDEGKKVTRKQLDRAIDGLNKAIKELTLVLPKWQEARDKGDDQAQATYLEELRDLTQKKQAAEKLVNQHIKDLDKNAELKITAESLREDGIVVTEGFTSKLNQIRQRAKSAGDFIKKTLSDAEFKMFNGNKKFELFLTDFYQVASESVEEAEEINEKKYWTLLNPGKGFVRKIAVNDYTKRPEQAAKWKDIKSATKAGKEFTKHHGVFVMVHVMNESAVYEATEVTKEMWDKEWNIKKAFGKDFERAYGLRVQAAMSKAKDEEQAEEWAYKNFKQLPNPAKGMTIEESVMNEANMKHMLTLESFLNEKTKFDPPVNHKSSDLKKQGAEWWFTVPFAEMKSRALGKTNFMTSDNVSDLDSEIWWTRQAFNHDGRAHAKILKMLAKHKGDYKGAGDRWEQYQEWIEQAMVGQGTMIQM